MCLFLLCLLMFLFFFFKQKTAYEMRISDWSSDVCSSDLTDRADSASIRLANRPACRESATQFPQPGPAASPVVPLTRRRPADSCAAPAALAAPNIQLSAGTGAAVRPDYSTPPARIDRKSTRLNSSH